jgi:hypothetical protein
MFPARLRFGVTRVQAKREHRHLTSFTLPHSRYTEPAGDIRFLGVQRNTSLSSASAPAAGDIRFLGVQRNRKN